MKQATTDRFVPAWWLPGPHLQTLWPSLLRRLPQIALRRECLELPDGDFLDLDWSPNNNGPLVVVLHGLEGSSRSHYAAGILHALNNNGWRAVLMHFRGCGGRPNRLSRGYHAGDTEDLEYVVRILRTREPAMPIAVIGYSLGGNVLLKWLGEQGAQAPLFAAAAISVPFDLSNATVRLNRGLSRLYQWVLLRRLRASMQRKWHDTHPTGQPPQLAKLLTLQDFDDQITAPLHGFADAQEYYSRCSSRQFLKNIHVPTLILHAEDDPFMSRTALPTPDELSPSIEFELTTHGGHVGFVSGHNPFRIYYYPELRVPKFLARQLAIGYSAVPSEPR